MQQPPKPEQPHCAGQNKKKEKNNKSAIQMGLNE
jgi:hypothetical protein